jgi:hypothetical protein
MRDADFGGHGHLFQFYFSAPLTCFEGFHIQQQQYGFRGRDSGGSDDDSDSGSSSEDEDDDDDDDDDMQLELYIQMEYCQNTLREFISSSSSSSSSNNSNSSGGCSSNEHTKKLQTVRQITEALAYLHASGTATKPQTPYFHTLSKPLSTTIALYSCCFRHCPSRSEAGQRVHG